ncbi:MAG: DUF4230 domain-containing protein [Hydrococcus sp. C42_A2020_068]|nr:DUF4230 domain-containing protein [Hydrococcus sp. C42_A2020_068]
MIISDREFKTDCTIVHSRPPVHNMRTSKQSRCDSRNANRVNRVSFLLKNFLLLSKGGIVLIILLLLWGMWRAGHRFLAEVEAFLNALNAPLPAPQINISSLIVDRIRGASELTTAILAIETVVPTAQERKLGNFVLGTTKLLYIARGEVKAGIDLSNLTAENVKVSNDTIQIRLPPPKILDNQIDINRSGVYYYDRGFLSLGPDVAPQLQTMAQRETLEKFVATACSEGLLEEANERAKLAIAQLLTTAGYEKVEVNATTPSPETCSATQ